MSLLKFHATGNWPAGALQIRHAPSSRPVIPQIEEAIETAWRAATLRPGVHLFDGPMARLESWHAAPDSLTLTLSQTSYKAFLGTNLTHPNLADAFGRQSLANPVGVSPALLTADNYLMMGRRNASVAYYPHKIHPFAGALEPSDPSPFQAVQRELAEELHFTKNDIQEIRCTGIAEDTSIRQPELIFWARTALTRQQVEARLDKTEHTAVWAIQATQASVDAALVPIRREQFQSPFTPVAVAAILLWGQTEFGDAWFTQAGIQLAES